MKVPLHSALLYVALSLELVIAPSVLAGLRTQSQLEIPYESHNRGQVSESLPLPPKNPDATAGGGSRDEGKCPQDAETKDQPLTALVPANRLGLTLAEHPTFLVYVPQTAAQVAEFSLFDQNNNGIYQTTFAVAGTPRIVSVSLPATAPPLKVGKDYKWSFALICAPKDRLQDRVVNGWLRRTNPDPALMSQVEKVAPQERVSLYAASGLWYEPLTTLYELRRSQPDDPNLTVAWKKLLHSGGLDVISAKQLRK